MLALCGRLLRYCSCCQYNKHSSFNNDSDNDNDNDNDSISVIGTANFTTNLSHYRELSLRYRREDRQATEEVLGSEKNWSLIVESNQTNVSLEGCNGGYTALLPNISKEYECIYPFHHADVSNQQNFVNSLGYMPRSNVDNTSHPLHRNSRYRHDNHIMQTNQTTSLEQPGQGTNNIGYDIPIGESLQSEIDEEVYSVPIVPIITESLCIV